MALSTIPAGIGGLVGQDVVERRLGRPGPTALLLAAAGAVMWAADRRPETRGIGPREVAAASAAQVVALAPGVSRTGITLTALRALGVHRQEAVRFSLLMSLPVTAGAAGLTVLRAKQRPPAVPTTLAAAAAFATTRLPLSPSRTAAVSAVYRLALATAVAVRLRRESR